MSDWNTTVEFVITGLMLKLWFYFAVTSQPTRSTVRADVEGASVVMVEDETLENSEKLRPAKKRESRVQPVRTNPGLQGRRSLAPQSASQKSQQTYKMLTTIGGGPRFLSSSQSMLAVSAKMIFAVFGGTNFSDSGNPLLLHGFYCTTTFWRT